MASTDIKKDDLKLQEPINTRGLPVISNYPNLLVGQSDANGQQGQQKNQQSSNNPDSQK